mmetsp:Transcript_9997/g.15138  ORF Transcript_9997/g.15138 Transcript_9997/m.15138 type:complete len:90 (-) Transcript_9997:1369-1638(-)
MALDSNKFLLFAERKEYEKNNKTLSKQLVKTVNQAFFPDYRFAITNITSHEGKKLAEANIELVSKFGVDGNAVKIRPTIQQFNQLFKCI